LIPNIDSEIGILFYTTKSAGCGGIIRKENKDFFVSEIISKKIHFNTSSNSGYTVYKLKKNGIDTTHALSDIFQRHGIRLKSLGLKDASAVTEQFVFTTTKRKQHFEINELKYSLKKLEL